ncbi:MAG TPA: M3 family metallopeptidase [Candidatus Eisenbacteria bacterium]|nr:M3 family metallopeptidase [Candidatus Eisenbacteria bacterium]
MTRLMTRTLRIAAPLALALSLGAVCPASSDAKTPKAKSSDPAFFSGHPDAAAFKAMEDAELKAAQSALDKMLAVKGKRTIENTLVPYNEVQMHGENAAYGSSLLEAVHPDSAFRADAEAQTQRATKFLDDLSLNRAVYDAIVQVDVSKADPTTRYFHEKTLRDFRLSGVDKDEATRAQISTLLDELTKTGQDFDRNIRMDSRTIKVDGPAALAGLPDDFIKSHPASEADGKITLSIEYPDLGPVMRYAKSEDTRRRLMHEAQNRAYPANMAVLDSLIVKRDRLAHVLGYPTWADYITQDKMIENAANAQSFIDRLKDTTFKRAHEEYAVYLKRKQEDDPKATQLNRWEASYYGRLIRMRDYDYDPGQARQYFPFDRVKQGVLDVTATMFGLTYKRVTNAATWDPSVEVYEVYEGPKMLGRFFLDLHPRPGKYNHAAKFTIRQGVRGYQVPEHALVCNFPGGKPGDPGLMEHSDVETFFHEFGHLIHAILGGQGQWEPVAGTATQRDFVEAPSQMLEEWCWDAKVLQTFAKNEKGEPIPAELVQKMRKADAFGRALGISTQAFYSAVSLSIYNRPPAQVNTDAIVTSLEPQFSPIPTMPDTHMQTAFGHLDGYSAYYYTYLWSLVIAKDMFSRFNHDNLLDPTVAKRYRDMVLAPGGSKPAKALVHEFLERDYDFKAFDEWLAGKG